MSQIHLHNALHPELTEERIRRGYHEQLDTADQYHGVGDKIIAAVIIAALCGWILGLACGLAMGAIA